MPSGPADAACSLLDVAKGIAAAVADRLVAWRTHCWLVLHHHSYAHYNRHRLSLFVTPYVQRYSRTLLISSLIACGQEPALQEAVAAAVRSGDWRLVWCGLEAMYRMFTLHDDVQLRGRLYYGVACSHYSGLSRFLAFQGFSPSSELVDACNWWARYLCFFASQALTHRNAGACARKRLSCACC